MILSWFRMESSPGIHPGFELGEDELGSGLVILHGPNASGKSSFCATVQSLLWEPDEGFPERLAAARWRDSGCEWHSELRGRELRWQRDGSPSGAPRLPPPHFAACYFLRLPELIAAGDESDHDFARRLRKEMWGGFDLEDLRRAFPLRSRSLKRLRKEELGKLRELRSREGELAELARSEQRLEELRGEVRGAKDARVEAQALALDLQAARKLPELLEVHAAVREERGSAEAGCRACGLAEPIDAAVIEALEKERLALWSATDEWKQARKRVGEAEVRERQAREAVPETVRMQPDLDWARGLDDLLESWERSRAAREAAEEKLRLYSDVNPFTPATPEGLRRAASVLEAWLQAPPPSTPVPGRTPLLLAAVLALGAGLLAVLAGGLTGALAALAAVLAALLVLRAHRDRKRGHPGSVGSRESEQRRFDALDGVAACAPESWDLAAVANRFVELRLATLAEEKRLAAVEELQRARAAEESRIQLLEDRLRPMAWEGEVFEAPLARRELVRRLAEWAAASAELAVAREAEERASARRQSRAARLREDLLPWCGGGDGIGKESILDTESAEVMVADLKQRSDELRECRMTLEKVTSKLVGIEKEIGELRGRLPDFPDTAEEREFYISDLEQRLEGARERSEGLQDLAKEQGRIQERLSQAREDVALEEALAAYLGAKAAYAEERAVALENAAGRFLLAGVEKEYQEAERPAILEKADRHFRRFCAGSHGIELDPRADRFRAREVVSGRGLDLHQLSDGTRVQLLLALRLAFLEEAEVGTVPPPLFLDEALSTADPGRFRTVGDSLLRIAAERQVFYLTANPADVRAWQRLAEEHRPPVELRIIDLGKLRALAALPEDDAGPSPIPAPVPLPSADLPPEEFAKRLGVPRFDPYAPAGAIHLYYLLSDDLPRLRSLLARGCTTLADTSLGDRDKLAGELLSVFRHGRPEPFPIEELMAAGIVSQNFEQDFRDLAHDLGYSAAAVLEALEQGRLKGFRRKRIEALEDWFQEHHYLDPRPALGFDEILETIRRRVASGALTLEETDWPSAAAFLLSFQDKLAG